MAEGVGIAEEGVPTPGQRRAQVRAFRAFAAPGASDGLVEQLHQMKPIECDRHARERVREPSEIGGRHVATQLVEKLGAAAVGDQVVAEAGEGAGVATGRGEEQPAVVEIDEEADVFVPTPTRGLVDAHRADPVVPSAPPRFGDMPVDQSPEARVVLIDQSGDGGHRHVRRHRQHQGLEEEREATAGPGPGYGDGVNPHRSQLPRGVRATSSVRNWKKSRWRQRRSAVSWALQPVAPHSAQAKVPPRRKSSWISSRLAFRSRSRAATYQGSARPRAVAKSAFVSIPHDTTRATLWRLPRLTHPLRTARSPG